VTFAEIIEATRTRPPFKVFHALIRDPSKVRSWTVYRAERFPTLYPH
jgi:hypothetical protein